MELKISTKAQLRYSKKLENWLKLLFVILCYRSCLIFVEILAPICIRGQFGIEGSGGQEATKAYRDISIRKWKYPTENCTGRACYFQLTDKAQLASYAT